MSRRPAGDETPARPPRTCIVALVALFGGVVTGLLQALEYAGVESTPRWRR